MQFLNKSCITDVLTEENQINNINNIKRAIEDHSIDFLLDNITYNGNDIVIEEKNMKYHILSSWNQNNNENISSIDLGNCENILKEKYNITPDIPLVIFKLDMDIEGYQAPIVEYEIYNPITKEQLILKHCKNEQIKVSIPVSIDENEIYKYNPNSEFYNDICSTYTTSYKTDITLKDRNKEFLNKNMTLCESDCFYSSYNKILKKVECNCAVKYRIKNVYEIQIDKEKLIARLNIKNLINIKVLKCYKKLFTKNGFLYNIGSYIFLSIILIYIVCLVYLILKDYSLLKSEIKDYFTILQNNKDINNIENKNIKNKKYSLKTGTSIDVLNNKNIKKEFLYLPPVFNKLFNNNSKLNMFAKIEVYNNRRNRNRNSIQVASSSLKKIIKKNKKNIILTEFELNGCSYNKALLCDKRIFCHYFFSLLKLKHLLLFAVIPSKDCNSKAIKICIFLFTFALFFADNAIFMNEETIHNIYKNHGTLDIIYQIPQIIYSNIISFIIDKIIRFLSLSQDDAIEEKIKIKREKKNKNFLKFFRKLFIKYIFFFIISFIFLFFFWFYISCFCFVYKNTQIYLIKDTLFSFGLSLIFPIFFYLLSSVFRIYSLKNRNRNIFYILSKLLML